MSSKKKRFSAAKSKAPTSLLRGISIGTVSGLFAFFVSLLIFSMLCTFAKYPYALVLPFSLSSNYLGAFFAGYVGYRASKESSPIICGILCGLSYMLTVMILLLPISAGSERMHFSWRLIDILCAVAGTFISSLPKGKRKKRKFK